MASRYYFPTTIDKFRRCPLHFKNYRTRKDLIPEYVARESTWIGNVTHKFLEYLFKGGQKMDTAMEPLWDRVWKGALQRDIPGDGYWQSEAHEDRVRKSSLFGVTSFLEDHPALMELKILGSEKWCHADYVRCPLGVKADLIGQYPDGTITVLDWKSGKKPYYERIAKYMANDSQMPVSGLVASKLYGIENPMVEIFWINAEFEHRTQFDAASLASWEEYYRKLIIHIEANTEWGPIRGKLCGWCDFQKTEACAAFDSEGNPTS